MMEAAGSAIDRPGPARRLLEPAESFQSICAAPNRAPALIEAVHSVITGDASCTPE